MFVSFSLVAGGGDLHRRRGKEEEKKSFQAPLFFSFSIGGTWTHAPPVTVARGKTRRHCSQHCSGVQMGFPAIFGVLGTIV